MFPNRMLDALLGAISSAEANHDVDMLKAGSYPYPLKMRILSSNVHLCNEDAGLVLKSCTRAALKRHIRASLGRTQHAELALVTVQSLLEDRACWRACLSPLRTGFNLRAV